MLTSWLGEISLMQQTVLLTALRGPDGITKDHPVKRLLRWYRRCVLLDAFTGKQCVDSSAPGGGSFMGPSIGGAEVYRYIDEYLRHIDELPHHFQLHFMHAVEILGYKYPDDKLRCWWHEFYKAIVSDMHLNIETEEQMDTRLGDDEMAWKDNDICLAN